jgi:hypothetical protein
MDAATVLAARAPDLVEPVIGYRQWRLDDGALWSPFAEYRWQRGVNTARCTVGGGHPEPPPGHACACGIYAWYRPCPRLGSATPHLVAGAIAVWGEVELHATGLRAQYAMIVAVVLPAWRGGKRRRVVELADAFEVEAVRAHRLRKAALGHGLPIRVTPGGGQFVPRPAARP